MGNAVECLYCGKQCTDHFENPLRLEVVSSKESLKSRTDYGDIVCDDYTPDIKDGELKCTCLDNKQWCNGMCHFQKPHEDNNTG